MESLQALFWISAVLGILSFIAFLGFAIEQILAARKAQQALAQASTPKFAPRDAESLVDAPDKLLDSLSKLADSLSKAPAHVAALIGCIFFLLLALAAATLQAHYLDPTKDGKARPATATQFSQPAQNRFFRPVLRDTLA